MNEGSKIFHPLHGVGTIVSIESKEVLGQVAHFSVSTFGDDGMKIMSNLARRDNLIRPLIKPEKVTEVIDYLKAYRPDLPSKAPARYSTNLQKLKSGDIYKMCEVVKGLTELSAERKLSPKDQGMLEKSRKNLAAELSHVRQCSLEEMVEHIDRVCKDCN